MPMKHRFDPAKWQGRVARRKEIQDNPGKVRGLSGIEDRIDVIEQAIGLKPARENSETLLS